MNIGWVLKIKRREQL